MNTPDTSSPFHGTITVRTWEELKQHIDEIRQQLLPYPDGQTPPLLFRGQENCRWKIETTLERKIRKAQIDCADYYKLALSIHSEIENNGGRFAVPDIDEIKDTLHSAYDLQATPLPALDYLIHLRHHTFPSPLLDWTQSLETAAFFAFHNEQAATPRSIYVFCEMPSGVKSGWRSEPRIMGLSHQICNLPGHRHEKQKSEYTVCLSLYGPNDFWSFTPHQDVLTTEQRRQDCLVQFVIPNEERDKIMKEVDARGINATSLMPLAKLDDAMASLIDRVFGPKGLAHSMGLM